MEKVGRIAVDAGIVMVGDPCYHLHSETQRAEFGTSWDDFVDKLDFDGPATQIGNKTALVCGGFGGDGTYPVYIERDSLGVKSLIIKFREDAGDEE